MGDAWAIDGEYMEACSCDYLCPCITSNATAAATQGFCIFAMTYRIDHGRFGTVDLSGLTFAIVAKSEAVMSAGNWVLGVIVDDRASDAQAAALADIATGKAGGPMAAFAPLVGELRGVERRPIRFTVEGARRSVTIGGDLEQSIEGVPSPTTPGACLGIDNTFHPANSRLNLAHAQTNVVKCFGLQWSDASGTTNGHFAPFGWGGNAPFESSGNAPSESRGNAPG
jgi:hypothetical protein